jgi:glycosyltransferase involved in cell wall biosynthesis
MPEPLRVLHVAQPTTAGVPTVLLGYLRDQLDRGWQVSVACPTEEGWLAAAAAAVGATVLPWPATRAPGRATVDEVARLRRLLRAADPDVVHLHSSKAGLAGRLGPRARGRTVFQPHAWSFQAAGLLRVAAVGWERNAARRTDALICVSAAERAAGVRHGITPPTWTVPNGVDAVALRPAGRSAARATLRIPDAPTVVCVGRLCPQKGQLDLLAAWPAVRHAVPTARLVLVGNGPDRPTVLARAAGRPEIRVVGEVVDVATWYAAADVVVVPSRWEGMALVPLEAMACGRSVVVTDVAGAVESVPAGAGAVVRVGDGDALADALVARLRDPARAAAEGTAGRAHVVSRHSAAGAANAVADIYAHVLGRAIEVRCIPNGR